jgi:hypothetical protein
LSKGILFLFGLVNWCNGVYSFEYLFGLKIHGYPFYGISRNGRLSYNGMMFLFSWQTIAALALLGGKERGF